VTVRRAGTAEKRAATRRSWPTRTWSSSSSASVNRRPHRRRFRLRAQLLAGMAHRLRERRPQRRTTDFTRPWIDAGRAGAWDIRADATDQGSSVVLGLGIGCSCSDRQWRRARDHGLHDNSNVQREVFWNVPTALNVAFLCRGGRQTLRSVAWRASLRSKYRARAARRTRRPLEK